MFKIKYILVCNNTPLYKTLILQYNPNKMQFVLLHSGYVRNFILHNICAIFENNLKDRYDLLHNSDKQFYFFFFLSTEMTEYKYTMYNKITNKNSKY